MEVILLEEIKKLGEKHSTVKVKNGYGRNYLIPQGLAIIANDTNTRIIANKLQVEENQMAKKLKDIDYIIEILQKEVLNISAKVGEENKLFGTVTTQNISDAIAGAKRCQRCFVTLEDMLAFFCTLIHRDAIKDVGLMDMRFLDGLGCDDMWCYQARKKEWKILLCYDAFAEHLHGTSFKRLGVKRDSVAAVKKFRNLSGT